MPSEGKSSHNEGCIFGTKDGSLGEASFCLDDSKVDSKWILTNKGGIVCPPKSMGDCGHQNMELKSSYLDNRVSELLEKTETIAEAGKVADALEASEGTCCCLSSHQRSELACPTLLALQEGRKGKCLHCPTDLNIEKNDIKHFQWHLCKGVPAVVPNVLNGTTGLSWEPLVMRRACRKARNTEPSYIQDFKVLNSSDCCERKSSDSNNCRQCHRIDKEAVVRCTKCKQKKYCIPCITPSLNGNMERAEEARIQGVWSTNY